MPSQRKEKGHNEAEINRGEWLGFRWGTVTEVFVATGANGGGDVTVDRYVLAPDRTGVAGDFWI